MYVKEGDSVTRGQVIGEVGNTGVSEGSHLHYEVRFRDNTVNPIHYFNKDMSPEAYVELMNQIEESTVKNWHNENYKEHINQIPLAKQPHTNP